MEQRSTILFVEDEQRQREALAEMFEETGYCVLPAETAEEALKNFQETIPDMIITDVKLPGMDGFTFYEEIRKHPAGSRIPFIFITGYNDMKAIDEAIKRGAAAYVTKPYDLEKLISLVKQHLSPQRVNV